MFDRILIANRGEIACRVARTARRMGVRTVAIYSDADAGALHVDASDEAYRVGPAAPRESYLDIDAIVAIARRSGAQAVHPGYGFLSENAAFARAVADADLVFIGPPAQAIDAMGSKSLAKRLVGAADVPLVPGYHGDDQGSAQLADHASRIGYPLLVKAVAGGGGKGMRLVRKQDDFAAALDSARREAMSSFADDRVLLEKYVTSPRHVEIQVFADMHGNVVHLFERDCSVQRRYQKVLEEAPAPHLTAQRRRAMGDAAIAAARAIDYVGAGTVEFIVAPDGSFYFMEMNTRLQVEHPVTEMITGLDLVEWQLRVAAGEPLPRAQEELTIHGHAIEARIYAEDPARGFLPAVGTIAHLRVPPPGDDVRFDSGVRQGDVISPYYDALIGKLIVHGADRKEALQKLEHALAACEIAGVASNAAFLLRLVRHDAFVRADLDTGLIARHEAELVASPAGVSSDVLLAVAMAEVDALNARARAAALASADPHSPWSKTDAWWLNSTRSGIPLAYRAGDLQYDVVVCRHADQWRVSLPHAATTHVVHSARRSPDGRLHIATAERVLTASVIALGEERHVFCAGEHRKLVRMDPLAQPEEREQSGGHLAAPMSGVVVATLVRQGQEVRKGEPLMVLEAMKMEHTIAAPADGVVSAINFVTGERVNEGADLIDIDQR